MVPQHVILNLCVDLYHLDDKHYSNITQNIENQCVFSIICMIISGVNTSELDEENMFPIKYDTIPFGSVFTINQVTTDALGATVSLTVVVQDS